VQERTPHWLFLTILAGLGMVGPFSIDTIFPAYASMGVEWGVSALALQQLASVYLLSFAVMSLLHGPLSDALGRKPVILAGSVVYILSAIGCALAPDLGVLLALRAVQGLSAGAGAIVSRAMVRDVFSDVQAQRTMSHIAMIFGLAPALAPLVGGWILGVGHWRDVFWFLAVFGTVLLVLVAFWMPETHPAAARTPFRPARLAGSLLEVWRLPAGRRLSVTAMFNFGGQFLYVAAAPLFVVQLLGLGEQDFWVLFVPMIGGMIAGSWASGRLAGRFSGRRIASVGSPCSPPACRGRCSRCRCSASGSRWRSPSSPSPCWRSTRRCAVPPRRCSRSSSSSPTPRSQDCWRPRSRSRAGASPWARW
jgi:DHA1 family bicyclomycin/chloramphenicol resistance-like MFS transporter